MVKVNVDPVKEKKYREEGFWGDATMLDYWELSAKSFPDKSCVVDNRGTRYTFKQLDELSDRLANYFMNEAKLQPGDFISVQIPNWSEFTLCFVAALKAGCPINPVMPKFRESELEYRLGKCKTKLFITPAYFQKTNHVELAKNIQKNLPALERLLFVDKEGDFDTESFDRLEDVLKKFEPLPKEKYVRANSNDIAYVLFTSGTEGNPKGVMITHNNMVANMKGYLALTQLNATDSMLMPVPVAHATGMMYGVSVPFMAGYSSVLLEKFDAVESLKYIERERCSAIEGPTVIAIDIMHELEVNPGKYDISSLRYFFCGGSPIPRQVVEKGLSMNIHILGVYGSTESAPHCVVAPFHPVEKVLTTDGKPVPGMEVKIVDDNGVELPPWKEGEEYSKGPNLFMGYIDEPEMTANAFSDGWFKSGDLCYKDEDGYIRITGRKKDVISCGGENINSSEVEGYLFKLPNCKEVAVVVYPDERLGEKACAYFVLHNPAEPITLEMVQEHMKKENVAKYKWPERVEIIDEIPKNASGKVLKYVLRDDVKKRMGLLNEAK